MNGRPARTALASWVAASQLILQPACGGPDVPPEVTCASATAAGSVAEAREALSSSARGDCVVLAAGTYPGRFEVPPGVTLTAEAGADVVITGDGAGEALVRLGSGSALASVELADGARHGAVIEGTSARLIRVLAIGLGASGVTVRCTSPGCVRSDAVTTLDRIEIRQSSYGLSVEGARVHVEGSVVSGSFAGAPAGGAGIYVHSGGRLEASASVVEDNLHGIVVAGAETTARLTNVVVRENGERGIWAQGLRGTAGVPALMIEGDATRIVDNGIAGVGARDSGGIIVSGGEIARTRLVRIAIGATDFADVGDGLALFEGCSSVDVGGARLEANGRAQALVDEGGTGIRFDPSNTVTATTGQHGIVVQNTTTGVEVPPRDRTPVQGNLPFSAPELLLPAL